MEGIVNEKLESTVQKTYLRNLEMNNKRKKQYFYRQMKAILLFCHLIFQYRKNNWQIFPLL